MMQTGRWTYRKSPGRRGARVAAGVLPLLGLLAPTAATAQGYVEILVCSGGVERVITVPAQDGPVPPPEDRQGGCAHFVCPRERAPGDPADDEE